MAYLAFDLEISKHLPMNTRDLMAYRPLGMSCAATLVDGEAPQLWYSQNLDGTFCKRMQFDVLDSLVAYLSDRVEDGDTILTWNGLGFDFDILAEESEDRDTCLRLARSHVDMMFHVFCEQGYPVSLAKACEGMKLKGKTVGINGEDIPRMWSRGDCHTVLNYVAQDVQATLELAKACEKKGQLNWITGRGSVGSLPLGMGWRTVEESMRQPLPDTSWMDNPIPRSRFTGWLDRT